MAIKNLRDFIAACEAEGELKRVKAEVDWNLEITEISTRCEEKHGPALLFENVKDSTGGVLTGAFSSVKRLGICLGIPMTSVSDGVKEWAKRGSAIKEIIHSKEVKTGPVLANIMEGKDVDLTKLPAPKFFPLDGGRYIGTVVFRIERDPETNRVHLDISRGQLFDRNTVGQVLVPGRAGDRTLRKYKALGKKNPVALMIGFDPLYVLWRSAAIRAADDFEAVATIRGEPVELITSDLTGLPLPAEAEIIIEGEMGPDAYREDEGPLGEYAGFYLPLKAGRANFVSVKRALYRDNPILWSVIPAAAKRVSDIHMMMIFPRTVAIWRELDAMRIPGIRGINLVPEAAGRFWVIISVKQEYPGHAEQVGAAMLATTTGHYGIKGIIVVDDDIDANNLGEVFWSLSVRYRPFEDTEIIKRGRATPGDPSLPPEANQITSKIIMNATTPFELKEKPVEVKMPEEIVEKVKSRWQEYGLD